MDGDTIIVSLTVGGAVIGYALRNESRLSKLEAKVDVLLEHFGLREVKGNE